jgi:hypothetical protein
MAGERWRELLFLGKQASQAQAVPATRRAYVMDPSLTLDRPENVRDFATGTRDSSRAARGGRATAGGSVRIDASASEALEWLEMTFGPATVSTPSGATLARRHVYVPGSTLPTPATVEYNSGAQLYRSTGAMVDTWGLDGSAAGDNPMTFGLFALNREVLPSMASGLAERVPTYYEGWETRVFIDALGDTPGTTEIVDAAIAWSVAYTNNLGRKAFANNAREFQKIVAGRIGLTGSIRLEASEAIALAEYLNWEADTTRLLRLELGNNVVIDAGTNEVQRITITGTPTGGTFTITWNGFTTAAIPHNATAAQVLSALLALPPFVYGDLDVTGGAGPGTPWDVEFKGRYSGMNVAQITTTDSLTGGSTPASAVTTTTPGVAGFKELIWIDVPLVYTGADITPEGEGTREINFPFQYLYDPTLAGGVRVTAQCARTTTFS